MFQIVPDKWYLTVVCGKCGERFAFLDAPSPEKEIAGGDLQIAQTANDHLKLDAALRSRCMPIPFDILHKDYPEVIARLCARYEQRLKELGFAVDPARLAEIVNLYFPDLRDIANRIEFKFAREAG